MQYNLKAKPKKNNNKKLNQMENDKTLENQEVIFNLYTAQQMFL